jgi:hypothetical protein
MEFIHDYISNTQLHQINRSQGYIRPGQRDLRISDYEVEIPSSASPSPDNSPPVSHNDDNEVVDFLS